MAGRNLAYDLLPGLNKAVRVPIICVGNLTTGGTGKTPMVAFLARHFLSRGLRVAILSRGYGRQNRQTQVIVTATNKTAMLSPDEIGDEALMLKRQLPEVTQVLDANRVRGATAIVENDLADLILMDDGFQHRRLRRDFNLIIIDSQRLFGNRQSLPAGPLREAISSLKRADAVIFNKFDLRHPNFYSQAAAVLSHIASHRLFCASYNYQKFSRLSDGQEKTLSEMKKGGLICAVAGLANNDYFFTQLRASGLELAVTVPFKDHHVYTHQDLIKLKELCRERPLLTTAKDADKLRLKATATDENFMQNIWVANIELKIDNPAGLLALLPKVEQGEKSGDKQ
jgi:tetraacyldisaccharide 4'-kinase